MPQGYSCQLSKTISSLLALRPENRPNAKDLLNSTFIQHHLDHFIEEKENIRVFYQERKTMLNLSPCIFRTKKHFVPYHLTLSPTRYDHGGSCDILEMTPTVVSRRASLLSNEELLKAPNNQCDTRRPKSSLGLVRTPADPSDYLLSPQTRTRLLSPEPLFNRFGSESAFSDTEFNSNDKLSEGDILDRNGHTDFTPDSEIREIPYIYTDDTDDLADESDQEWDEVIRSARHTRSTAASLGPNPLKKQLSDTTAQLAKKHSVILKTKTWSI